MACSPQSPIALVHTLFHVDQNYRTCWIKFEVVAIDYGLMAVYSSCYFDSHVSQIVRLSHLSFDCWAMAMHNNSASRAVVSFELEKSQRENLESLSKICMKILNLLSKSTWKFWIMPTAKSQIPVWIPWRPTLKRKSWLQLSKRMNGVDRSGCFTCMAVSCQRVRRGGKRRTW